MWAICFVCPVDFVSQCCRQQALDVFHSHLFNSTDPEVAVIGGGCSLASEALAEISQYYNMSVVSWSISVNSFMGNSWA